MHPELQKWKGNMKRIMEKNAKQGTMQDWRGYARDMKPYPGSLEKATFSRQAFR
jgi:hypothetical protein